MDLQLLQVMYIFRILGISIILIKEQKTLGKGIFIFFIIVLSGNNFVLHLNCSLFCPLFDMFCDKSVGFTTFEIKVLKV